MVLDEMPRRYDLLVPSDERIEEMRRLEYTFLYNICHKTAGNLAEHAEKLGINPEDLQIMRGVYDQDPAYASFSALFVKDSHLHQVLRSRPLLNVFHGYIKKVPKGN